jgi:Tfp pilus assembly protein PilP
MVLLSLLSLSACHQDEVEKARQQRLEAHAKEVEQIRDGLRFAAKLYTLGDADAPINNAVWVIEIEGHKYASFGSGLTHLESCSCKQGHNPPSR